MSRICRMYAILLTYICEARFFFQESATRYWDTMAVHIAMCGMEASQYQDYARAVKMRETRRAIEKEVI